MKKLCFVTGILALSIVFATHLFADAFTGLAARAGLQSLPSRTKSVDFNLSALDANRESVKLSSFTGKVVLLNFFATWCGPCRSEMPDLENVYSKLKDQGFVVLAVDVQERPSEVMRYASELGLTFPIGLDESGRVSLTYGARALPTSYLIDRRGDVVAGTIGAHPWNDERTLSLINAMLAQ